MPNAPCMIWSASCKSYEKSPQPRAPAGRSGHDCQRPHRSNLVFKVTPTKLQRDLIAKKFSLRYTIPIMSIEETLIRIRQDLQKPPRNALPKRTGVREDFGDEL